jgi:hypothetical protein
LTGVGRRTPYPGTIEEEGEVNDDFEESPREVSSNESPEDEEQQTTRAMHLTLQSQSIARTGLTEALPEFEGHNQRHDPLPFFQCPRNPFLWVAHQNGFSVA